MITYQEYCNKPELANEFYAQFVDAKIIGQTQFHYNALQVISNWANDPKWIDKTDWMPMAAYLLALNVGHFEEVFENAGMHLNLRRVACITREAARMYSKAVVEAMLEEIDYLAYEND